MPNPAVNPTCAKSRAGRLLRHWASHPEGIREIESGAMLRAYHALLATHVGASTRLQILGLRMVALRTNPRRYLRGYGHGLVSLFLLVAVQATAQVVRIDNSPKRFSVVPPKSWVQQPPSTGNSRVKFSAPSGTPPAECTVIVQEFPALRGKSQQEFDIGMAQPADPNEVATQLSARYNNVQIVSTGAANVSGHPAQLVNVQYSVGTPAGEQWARGFTVTAVTTPGVVWTVTCGALGRTAQDAQRGYSFWQLELVNFPTHLKILQ